MKLLLASGGDLKEVADYLKIGYSTIKIINRSETYEDYRHTIMAMGAKQTEKRRAERAKESITMIKPVAEQETKPEPKEEPKQVIYTATANAYQTNRMIDLMKQQLEMLTLISNKVAFIVDELTMPVKKEG